MSERAAAISAAISASGVQVRHGPAPGPGQQPDRRHFGGRVEGLEVAGETAHDAQPVAHIGWVDVLSWQPRPGQRQVDGDGLRAGGLHEVDEAVEQPRVSGELAAQRATNRDVVLGRLLQLVHAAPLGHGRARVRNARRSTFA